MRKLAISLLAMLGKAAEEPQENYQDLTAVEPKDSAPWKVRLHDANRDRRASRKKRAKKLNRRR